jgi:ABC-type dipeptide/oligopeptide/nickel transport system permease subunit
MKTTSDDTEQKTSPYKKSRRTIRVLFSRIVVLFAVIIILLTIVIAVFAPFLAPYDPYEQNLSEALLEPSAEHWLGTDSLGRDELSRVIYGTRISLQVGLIAVGIAAVLGFSAGLVAGYFGGMLDTIIMRVIDSLMAIPTMVLILAISAALGGGLQNIMIAVAIGMSPEYCRMIRSMAITIKETEYITAGRAVGAGHLRVMLRHILPNSFPPLIVLVTLSIGYAIQLEASLSFLGIGIAPPGAAWGSMVNDGYKYLMTDPMLSFAPGACIMLLILSINMLGDGLRDALDPRLRGAL